MSGLEDPVQTKKCPSTSSENRDVVPSEVEGSEPEGSGDSAAGERLPAVVIDLGKIKKKQVRRLKHGGGPLVDEVELVMDTVRQQLSTELEGRALLPVVLLYEIKGKKKRILPW